MRRPMAVLGVVLTAAIARRTPSPTSHRTRAKSPASWWRVSDRTLLRRYDLYHGDRTATSLRSMRPPRNKLACRAHIGDGSAKSIRSGTIIECAVLSPMSRSLHRHSSNKAGPRNGSALLSYWTIRGRCRDLRRTISGLSLFPLCFKSFAQSRW
jgi:hypothetical protein